MQCDGPDAVEARETAAWLSRVGGRDNREMCRGWTTCDNGDLCLGGLDKDCCCCYPDGYVPYVHRQAGMSEGWRWCTMTSAVSKR